VCSMQCAITFAVMWLPCPSIIRNRRCVGSSLVDNSNTVVNHSYVWLSDVQLLLLVENRQSRGVSAGIHVVFVCFALKITSGGIATPAALTHSIAVIHSCWPFTTFQFDCSRMLTNVLKD